VSLYLETIPRPLPSLGTEGRSVLYGGKKRPRLPKQPRNHIKCGKSYFGNHFQWSTRTVTATWCFVLLSASVHNTTLAFLLVPALTLDLQLHTLHEYYIVVTW